MGEVADECGIWTELMAMEDTQSDGDAMTRTKKFDDGYGVTADSQDPGLSGSSFTANETTMVLSPVSVDRDLRVLIGETLAGDAFTSRHDPR